MTSPITFISSLPPISKSLFCSIFVVTLLSFILRTTLAPRDIHPFWAATGVHINYTNGITVPWTELQIQGLYWRPWTLLTAAFVERGFIDLALSLFFAAFYGPRLEQKWGQKEFIRFGGIVIVATHICFLMFVYLLSALEGDSERLRYWNSWNGMGPLRMAFLVADAQLRPTADLAQSMGGSFPIRPKVFPLVSLLFSLFSLPVITWSPYPLTIPTSFYLTWFYIRFIQLQSNGSKGDRTEHWAFKEWFWWNETLRGFFGRVGDAVWVVGRRLGLESEEGVLPTTHVGGSVTREVVMPGTGQRLGGAEQSLGEPSVGRKIEEERKIDVKEEEDAVEVVVKT